MFEEEPLRGESRIGAQGAPAERRASAAQPALQDPSAHALKTLRATIDDGDKTAATAALSATVSLIDKLVGKGIIHDNAAGRYKSRLTKQVSGLS